MIRSRIEQGDRMAEEKVHLSTLIDTAATANTSLGLNPRNFLYGNCHHRTRFLANPASRTFFRIDKDLSLESLRDSLTNLPDLHFQEIKPNLNRPGLCF